MLFHGSKRSLPTLKRRQLTTSPDRSELERRWKRRNAIYLSPSLAFALFFAVKPLSGQNMMSIRKGIVYFEKLDEINPEDDVYIHVVDISDIPTEKRKWINEYELEVRLDEIKPVRVETHKAGEIFEHFQVIKDKEEFLRQRAS